MDILVEQQTIFGPKRGVDVGLVVGQIAEEVGKLLTGDGVRHLGIVQCS